MNNILNYYWTDTPSYQGHYITNTGKLELSSGRCCEDNAGLMAVTFRNSPKFIQTPLTHARKGINHPTLLSLRFVRVSFFPPVGWTSKFQTSSLRLKLQASRPLWTSWHAFKEAVRSQSHGDSSFGHGPGFFGHGPRHSNKEQLSKLCTLHRWCAVRTTGPFCRDRLVWLNGKNVAT